MKNTIFEQIQSEVDFCNETELPMNLSYVKTQKDLLELINLYLSSKFRTGNTTSEGTKKHFYNISNFRCAVGSKATDLDTKDIKLIAEDGQSFYPAWFLEKELKLWMKQEQIGQLLNKIVYALPKYGSVVVKAIQDKLTIVNLTNLFCDPTAESLKQSGFVIERHLYTPQELKKKGWDNTDEVISHWRSKKSKLSKKKENRFIEIYERYGEVPDKWLGEGDGFTNALIIVYPESEAGKGVVLHKTKTDNFPYREVHWERSPGRWLGRGVMETMFENQIRANELANLKAQGLRWTALHLFQSRDDLINRNLLVDTVNGEILRVRSEITPIANEERNLAAYSQEEARWDVNSDQKTFAYDVIRGQRAPAGTPLGSSVLQTQMAGGYFKMKQEDIGLFLKDLLLSIIIPAFKKNNRMEHILNLVGTDEAELEKLDALIIRLNVEERVRRDAWSNGEIPSAPRIEVLKALIGEQISKLGGRYETITSGLYENIKFKVDVVITGEQIDLSSKITTLQSVLAIVGSNPTILQDPRTRRVFNQLLNYAGISPLEFSGEEEKGVAGLMAGAAKRGGGMARPPAPSATPSIIKEEVNV